jgi:prephenate dehydratase
LFAIHNRAGLFVDESLDAMSQHIFSIQERRNTLITHHLMKRVDTPIDHISHIMAHPQVFLQCQDTMRQDYPTWRQESGSGDYIDTARAAQALAH